MIDHHVHGLTTRGQVFDARQQQPVAFFTTDRWQNYEPRMNRLASHQIAKVLRVERNVNPVFLYAPRKNGVIAFAAPAGMKRMYRIMVA